MADVKKRAVPRESRAYAMLNVSGIKKATNAAGNPVFRITGMATTPTPDRMNDVVDPLGATFKTPMPLLWQHDHCQPVGLVTMATPSADGIPFVAELPILDTPGTLKDRIDEAIQSVQHGLVAAVSIGFRVINDAIEYIVETGGFVFQEWEWYELSLVTIPANADATIATAKSLDRKFLPPPEGHEAGPSGRRADDGGNADKRPRGPSLVVKALTGEGKGMNVQKQIETYTNTRAAKVAARDKIMEDSAAAGVTLDAEQAKEYDTLAGEVRSIDEHLARLNAMKAEAEASATPATGDNVTRGVDARGARSAIVPLAKALPPGIALARYAICKIRGMVQSLPASEIAKNLYPDMAQLHGILDGESKAGGMRPLMEMQKAAVPAATTTDATWARPLIEYTTYLNDFVEFLRPRTIIGQFGVNGIPGFRALPFNVHVKGQTSGGAAYWVGEGQAKPLTKFDFNDVYLGWTKLACIAVVTDEILRFSNPGIEAMVRDALAEAIVGQMDISFIDPTSAAITGIRPASVTNGVTPITASGVTAANLRADIVALFAAWVGAANLDTRSAVLVMDTTAALKLASMRTTLESTPQFPGLSINGGNLDGIPTIVSNYLSRNTAGGTIALIAANEIYMADDGETTVDASREASLQMDTAPTNASGPTVAATTTVSMFQTNSLALRAERYVNWQKRRAAAVQVLTGVNYGS